ncbi:MAG TPA: hypothetical protein VMC61_02200 [Methanocella sp.]|nr:hypothetical protein [Methanocella sp.]
MGSNTKSSRGALAAALIIVMLSAFCGCIQIQDAFKPKPTIAPIVTITPTPVPPTATPAPTPVVRQMSTDVKVMPFGERGLVDFGFFKDSEIQRENISVVLANDGDNDAKNVVLTLVVTDAHGGDTLVQQKYKVGDLHRGDRKEYSMETENHGITSSVLLDVTVEWGENGEYYNPTTFVHLARSIWG